MIEALRAFTRPLYRRLLLLLSRGVVRLVDDGKGLQAVQVDLLKSETRDRLERFQEYGLSSVPHAGAEAVAAFVGGNRDHGVVLAVADRRYRVRGLTTGQVALYDSSGTCLLLDADGNAQLTAAGKVTVKAPLVRIEGDLEVTGEITDRADADGTSMEFIRNRFNQHVHPLSGGGNTEGPNPPMP